MESNAVVRNQIFLTMNITCLLGTDGGGGFAALRPVARMFKRRLSIARAEDPVGSSECAVSGRLTARSTNWCAVLLENRQFSLKARSRSTVSASLETGPVD